MSDESFISLFTFKDQDWRDKSKCRETGIDIFYPVDANGEPDATYKVADEPGNPGEYCNKCLVRRECLQYAIDNKIYDGVFGGMNEADRRKLINARVKQKRNEAREKREQRRGNEP